MHFCNQCQNMYYIRIDGENTNKLVYYCRHCGNEDSLLTIENISVSKTQLKKSEQSFSHIINQYTKIYCTFKLYKLFLLLNFKFSF